MLGPARVHRKYSDWAEVSLLAAGLDPAAIPAHRLADVLEVLERTGRTVPEAEFVSSQEAMARRKALLNFGKDGR